MSEIVPCQEFCLRQRPFAQIDGLAADIEARGQTTPLFVRPRHEKQQLLSGYRRFDALRKAGVRSAIVRVYRGLSDEEAYDLAVSENQERDALTDLERAEICVRLKAAGRTVAEIARQMGWRGEASVYRHLRIAKEAPAVLRSALQERRATMALATAFLDHAAGLAEEKQLALLERAHDRELSVSEFKREVAKELGGKARPRSGGPIQKSTHGFLVRSVRVDARDVATIDDAIAVWSAAVKKARRLKRRLNKESKS